MRPRRSGQARNGTVRDLFWVGLDRLLVDERDDHAGTADQGQPSTTTKHVYEVDLTHATNLLTQSATARPTWE